MRPMIELLWASVEAAGYFVRSVKLKFPLFINVRKRYKTGADHSWGTKYFMSYAKKKSSQCIIRKEIFYISKLE